MESVAATTPDNTQAARVENRRFGRILIRHLTFCDSACGAGCKPNSQDTIEFPRFYARQATAEFRGVRALTFCCGRTTTRADAHDRLLQAFRPAKTLRQDHQKSIGRLIVRVETDLTDSCHSVLRIVSRCSSP